jgi:hypothetical protein
MIDYDPTTPTPQQKNRVTSQPWGDEIEKKIRKFQNQAKDKSKQHEDAGYAFKKQRLYFALPAVVIPAVMAPVSSLIGDESWAKYVNTPAFALTSFFSVVAGFFKFNEMKDLHFQFSAKYSEIDMDIETELTKSRKYRKHVDVLLAEIVVKLKILNGREPVIPKGIIENFKLKKNKKEKEKETFTDIEENNDTLNSVRSLEDILQQNQANIQHYHYGNISPRNLSSPNFSPHTGQEANRTEIMYMYPSHQESSSEYYYPVVSLTPRHTPVTDDPGSSSRNRYNFY